LLLVLSGLAVIEIVLYQICTHVLIRLVAFVSGFRLFHIEKSPKGGMVALRLTVINVSTGQGIHLPILLTVVVGNQNGSTGSAPCSSSTLIAEFSSSYCLDNS
jgi:hypothetical protein